MVSTQLKNNASIGELELSETYTISPENFVENFLNGEWDYCEREYYIRESIPQAHIDKKKDELVIFNPDTGESYIKIIDSLTFYQSEKTGKMHLINGNERTKAILEMWSDEKYKELTWTEIPYKILLNPMNDGVALQYQSLSNDTGIKHQPMMLAKMIDKYYMDRSEYYKKKEGVTHQESKSLATRDSMKILGNISEALLSYYKSLAASPEWMQVMVETGEMAAKSLKLILDATKSYCKKIGLNTDEDYQKQLILSVMNIKAIATGRKNYIPGTNTIRIEPADIKEYFETSATKSTKDPVKTIEDLIDTNAIDVDAAERAIELINNDEIDEQKLVESIKATLNDVTSKVNSETVENAARKIAEKNVAKDVEYDDFLEIRNSIIKDISNQNVNDLLENNHVNSDLAKVTTDGIKLINMVIKYYKTSDAKKFYLGIRDLLMEILPDLDVIYGEETKDLGVIYKILSSISTGLSDTEKQLGREDNEEEEIENSTEQIQTEGITAQNEKYLAKVE